MKTIKYFRDKVAKQRGLENWRELDFVFSGRVPTMYWNRAVEEYVQYRIRLSQRKTGKTNKSYDAKNKNRRGSTASVP